METDTPSKDFGFTKATLYRIKVQSDISKSWSENLWGMQ